MTWRHTDRQRVKEADVTEREKTARDKEKQIDR